jgi:hypothetical protein
MLGLGWRNDRRAERGREEPAAMVRAWTNDSHMFDSCYSFLTHLKIVLRSRVDEVMNLFIDLIVIMSGA